MKFCRFDDERLGLIDGNKVRDVTAALDVLPRCSYPLPQHDIFIANLEAVTTRARAVAKDVRALPLESVTLLSPVANPGKIIAAPVNYQKHLTEVRDNPQLQTLWAQGLVWGFAHLTLAPDTVTVRMLTVANEGDAVPAVAYAYTHPRRSMP